MRNVSNTTNFEHNLIVINNAVFFVAQFESSACTINKIQSLIGQLLIAHVLNRIFHCISNCLVSNLNLVVLFVILAKSLNDFDSNCFSRFVHSHPLESTHKCTILFEVFAILFPGSRGNDLNSTLSQCGLQHVAHVVSITTCCACTAHHMSFVNEQNAVFLLFERGKNLLKALFEIASILRTSKHSADIKTKHFVILNKGWHLAFVNLPSNAFGNCSLTDARIADKHYVTLMPARKNQRKFFNFVVSANYRVDLIRRRFDTQVSAIQRQHFILFCRISRCFGLFVVILGVFSHVLNKCISINFCLLHEIICITLFFREKANKAVNRFDCLTTGEQNLRKSTIQHSLNGVCFFRRFAGLEGCDSGILGVDKILQIVAKLGNVGTKLS